ncbi:MAG: (d)CMP kinase [Christensenellales bacterium]
MNIAIAVDGPAGAGKSTVAKLVAQKLGLLYLDTGAMYRAVALYMLENGIDYDDKDAVAASLDEVEICVAYENNIQTIYLNGSNVTNLIRTPQVTKAASGVALIPEVRLKLVEIQRQIAADNNVIMDGRDIGTYVLPNANYKFFLTASVQERARRRYLEQVKKGIEQSQEEIEKEIAARDHNDSTRAFAPLKQAEGAILVDTTGMDIDSVVHYILQRVERQQ